MVTPLGCVVIGVVGAGVLPVPIHEESMPAFAEGVLSPSLAVLSFGKTEETAHPIALPTALPTVPRAPITFPCFSWLVACSFVDHSPIHEVSISPCCVVLSAGIGSMRSFGVGI